jgi:carboxypeptidase family protein
MKRSIKFKTTMLLVIPLVLTCFGLSPEVQALPVGTSALEGVVKDPTGRPIKGADVRIEATNGTNFSKIVKTDSHGHYICVSLVAGTYKVTLVVNGSIKASIVNAKTKLGSHTQLNFNSTEKTASAKTHRVWVPPDTGTHIGNGVWVEVDENGNIVSNTGVNSTHGFSSVEKGSWQWTAAAPTYNGSTQQKPAKLGGQ